MKKQLTILLLLYLIVTMMPQEIVVGHSGDTDEDVLIGFSMGIGLSFFIVAIFISSKQYFKKPTKKPRKKVSDALLDSIVEPAGEDKSYKDIWKGSDWCGGCKQENEAGSGWCINCGTKLN